MSPKWNNYPIYPDRGDSSSANVHPVLIKHACVLKAKLAVLCFPLGAFWELKPKQGQVTLVTEKWTGLVAVRDTQLREALTSCE